MDSKTPTEPKGVPMLTYLRYALATFCFAASVGIVVEEHDGRSEQQSSLPISQCFVGYK